LPCVVYDKPSSCGRADSEGGAGDAVRVDWQLGPWRRRSDAHIPARVDNERRAIGRRCIFYDKRWPAAGVGDGKFCPRSSRTHSDTSRSREVSVACGGGIAAHPEVVRDGEVGGACVDESRNTGDGERTRGGNVGGGKVATHEPVAVDGEELRGRRRPDADRAAGEPWGAVAREGEVAVRGGEGGIVQVERAGAGAERPLHPQIGGEGAGGVGARAIHVEEASESRGTGAAYSKIARVWNWKCRRRACGVCVGRRTYIEIPVHAWEEPMFQVGRGAAVREHQVLASRGGDLECPRWRGGADADVAWIDRSACRRNPIDSEHRRAAHLRRVAIYDAGGGSGGGHVDPRDDARVGVEGGGAGGERADW